MLFCKQKSFINTKEYKHRNIFFALHIHLFNVTLGERGAFLCNEFSKKGWIKKIWLTEEDRIVILYSDGAIHQESSNFIKDTAQRLDLIVHFCLIFPVFLLIIFQ